jgi:iron-sulfur cluster assembly protein
MVETLEQKAITKIDTGIVGAEESDAFMMTSNAMATVGQIKEANNVPAEYFLRIGSRSGGCSGMQYTLGFDSEINDNDKELAAGDVKMVIDKHSLFYLQGVTLDYVDGPSGSGFVFNNPNNSHACGCGGGGH